METTVFVAGFLAGGVATLSGFGIGSLLTPILAATFGVKLAVTFVAVPHFAGTAIRFLLLRSHIDKRVLLTFGVTSAIGGLIGAVLHIWLKSAVLGYVLAALLVFAGVMGVTRLSERLRFGRAFGWVAGALSGMFGGLVGNQGGIRSAALLGFDISKESFVATATAIGLVVDLFRVPVYIGSHGTQMIDNWQTIGIATMGVLMGTFVGKPILMRVSEPVYRTLVSIFILALGIWMFLNPDG